MTIDFAHCEVRRPRPDEWVSYYQSLHDVFPYDRPLYRRLIAGRFANFEPYALYRGRELLGNVTLVPLGVWLGGQVVRLTGVSAVATMPPYRRQGVARYLLEHCLRDVDQRGEPAALHTDRSIVYEGVGFRTVEQAYPAAPAEKLVRSESDVTVRPADSLSPADLATVRAIYDDKVPGYDGKAVREPGAWELYEAMFNPYPNHKLAFALRGPEPAAYAAFEPDAGRVTLTELSADPDDGEAVAALVSFVADSARRDGLDLVTIALPPGHFIWEHLRSAGVEASPEPPGVRREILMLRPAAGKDLGPLADLQWSLADKF